MTQFSETCPSDHGEGHEKNHIAYEIALQILHWTSTTILILFTIEIVAKFFAFGPRYFTKSWLHIFDAAVIITSLILQIVLHGIAAEIASFLIFLRFWRVIRIIDAVAVLAADRYEKRIVELKKEIEELKAAKFAESAEE